MHLFVFREVAYGLLVRSVKTTRKIMMMGINVCSTLALTAHDRKTKVVSLQVKPGK